MKLIAFLRLLIATLLVKTVCAPMHTNEDGVTTKYIINFTKRCQTDEGKIVTLLGLSAEQCIQECGLRKHCIALNFKRHGNVCELLWSEGKDLMRTAGCIHVRASDIEILQKPCDDCEYGKVCDTVSKQCIYKECLSFASINNVKILGNVNDIEALIRYECKTGYTERNGVTNAACLHSGQWSAVANCSCPSGWERFKGSCYLFLAEFRGWEDAKVFCESQKAHLLKVDDSEEDDYIRSVISVQQYKSYYWIGGRFDVNNNDFRWTDGTAVTFNGWAPNKPGSSKGCIDYLKHGNPPWQWNSHFDCVNTEGPSICEIN